MQGHTESCRIWTGHEGHTEQAFTLHINRHGIIPRRKASLVSLTRVLRHGEGRNVVELVVMAEGGITTPPLNRSHCSARTAKIHVSTRMRHSRPCLPPLHPSFRPSHLRTATSRSRILQTSVAFLTPRKSSQNGGCSKFHCPEACTSCESCPLGLRRW